MDRIFSSLVGLAGACNNNSKTNLTDQIVIEALSFPLRFPDAPPEEMEAVKQKVLQEKFRISPTCATCEHPCGNTSDYDLTKLTTAPKEEQEKKRQVLLNIQRIALSLQNNFFTEAGKKELDSSAQEKLAFLYKGIAYLSYELSENSLNQLVADSIKLLEEATTEG